MKFNTNRNVSVIGQGYVGLPLALAAANSGWNVTGIEVDASRFGLLSSGISPIEGIETDKFHKLINDGRYRVETEFNSLQTADIIVVCVPTPLDLEEKCDLTALNAVIDEIDSFGKSGALIVNESTSHPGTLREIFSGKLEKVNGIQRFEYAVAPERIDPGNEKFSLENTPRVIGGLSEHALNRASEFYGSFCREVVKVSSPEVAEMAKLLENSFRLVNISLINEISLLSATIGLNTREVVDAANTKPFGFMKFFPSIGIGGHCIPIDPVYLSEYSRRQGVQQTLIEKAKEIDNEMTSFIANRVKSLFPNVCAITIVGVGYKAGSRDTRHSPSIRLMQRLRESGYKIDWLDSNVQRLDDEVSNTELASQLAIMVAPDFNFDAASFLRNGGKIMDFTGSLTPQNGVFQF